MTFIRNPVVALTVASLTLLGCSSYRVTVTQGNLVKNDRLEQLEPGMTPAQVEYLLGTPLLRSAVADDRWDYVLKIQRGADTLAQRRVTVFFTDGVVARVEDTQPTVDSEAGLDEALDAVGREPGQS